MKRRALFLDRDGVINEDTAYIGTVDRFIFKDDIFELLRSAQDKGYVLVIVTNQSGVARGLYSAQDHFNLTDHMMAELHKRGIVIDLQLECFDLKDGAVAAYRNDSFWRKPAPGMILEAIARLNIDPARSLMLGDKETDMQAAQAAGVGTLLLLSDKSSGIDGVRRVRALGEVASVL